MAAKYLDCITVFQLLKVAGACRNYGNSVEHICILIIKLTCLNQSSSWVD